MSISFGKRWEARFPTEIEMLDARAPSESQVDSLNEEINSRVRYHSDWLSTGGPSPSPVDCKGSNFPLVDKIISLSHEVASLREFAGALRGLAMRDGDRMAGKFADEFEIQAKRLEAGQNQFICCREFCWGHP